MAPKPRDFFFQLTWSVLVGMDQYQDYKLLLWELMGSQSANVCTSQSCRAGEDFFGKSLLDNQEKGGIPGEGF